MSEYVVLLSIRRLGFMEAVKRFHISLAVHTSGDAVKVALVGITVIKCILMAFLHLSLPYTKHALHICILREIFNQTV